MRDNLKTFDFEKWMRNNNIPLYYKGANVGKGWVGTNCPFCPDGDSGGHLGINKKTKVISCWRCKTTGNIITLIKKLFPSVNIKEVLNDNTGGKEHFEPTKAETFANKCVLPTRATRKIYKAHGEYLKNRNFDPRKIYDEYNLHSIGIDAVFGYRIIIPVYRNSQLITFTARDITGKSKIRYKACPKEYSVLDPKSLVYNIDSADKRLILVEGATDVWRIGRGCGALMGASIVDEQIEDIVSRNFTKISILFDNDNTGRTEGEKLGQMLALYTNVEIMHLPEHLSDPGEMTTEDVNILRRYVFGKIY
jgi:hypothetical protein